MAGQGRRLDNVEAAALDLDTIGQRNGYSWTWSHLPERQRRRTEVGGVRLTEGMVWDECEAACTEVFRDVVGSWSPAELLGYLRRELRRLRFPTVCYGTEFALQVMAYAEGPWLRYCNNRKVWYRS